MGRAQTNQLGSATAGESVQEKNQKKTNLGRFQLCANPLSQSHLTPFPKGCVLCSRKIYPFPTRCHSQISCRRGKRRPTPVRISAHLPQAPALGSAHAAAPRPALQGAWPQTPPADRAAPGDPGLGCPRGCAPGSAGGEPRGQAGSHRAQG